MWGFGPAPTLNFNIMDKELTSRELQTIETVLSEKAAALRIDGFDNTEFYENLYNALTKVRRCMGWDV